MCFFSPLRNDPKKHKQKFGTHPVPGQSCKFVYVFVSFLLKHRDATGRCVCVIQTVMYIALSTKRRAANFSKSIAVQMGAAIAILFKSIKVKGRCDSPEESSPPFPINPLSTTTIAAKNSPKLFQTTIFKEVRSN